METRAEVVKDRVTFACPGCSAPYSWSTALPSAKQHLFSVSCEACGVAFSVRNPEGLFSATSPVVSEATEAPRSEHKTPAAVVPAAGLTTRKISIGSFAASIFAFLLPFMAVTCQGQKVHTFSGRELVTGGDIETTDMFGNKSKKHMSPEPLAALALLAAVIGFVAAVSSKAQVPIAGICAVVGVGLLFWLKAKLETDAVNQTQGMVQIQPQFGFWLAMVLLASAAIVNFGVLERLFRMNAEKT